MMSDGITMIMSRPVVKALRGSAFISAPSHLGGLIVARFT
jgi:hypothetical protein